jgi:hypothetical protein
MHQQLFAYIHANARTYTREDTYANILQSLSPPPLLAATAKLQLVLSEIQGSFHELQLQFKIQHHVQ